MSRGYFFVFKDVDLFEFLLNTWVHHRFDDNFIIFWCIVSIDRAPHNRQRIWRFTLNHRPTNQFVLNRHCNKPLTVHLERPSSRVSHPWFPISFALLLARFWKTTLHTVHRPRTIRARSIEFARPWRRVVWSPAIQCPARVCWCRVR